jgi:hypothetical protein
MNDTELDKLLDRWTAPSAPASLRASVRAGFAEERRLAGHPRRASKRWLWAAFAGAVAILLVAALARPGAAAVRIPYLVDSEFLRYADGGTGDHWLRRVVPGFGTVWFRKGALRVWMEQLSTTKRYSTTRLPGSNPGWVEASG